MLAVLRNVAIEDAGAVARFWDVVRYDLKSAQTIEYPAYIRS